MLHTKKAGDGHQVNMVAKEKYGKDWYARFKCNLPFITSTGRTCKCDFMDYSKFRKRRIVEISQHKHISFAYNEFECDMTQKLLFMKRKV